MDARVLAPGLPFEEAIAVLSAGSRSQLRPAGNAQSMARLSPSPHWTRLYLELNAVGARNNAVRSRFQVDKLGFQRPTVTTGGARWVTLSSFFLLRLRVFATSSH